MKTIKEMTNVEIVTKTLQEEYDKKNLSKKDIETVIENLIALFPAVPYSQIKIKYREEDLDN